MQLLLRQPRSKDTHMNIGVVLRPRGPGGPRRYGSREEGRRRHRPPIFPAHTQPPDVGLAFLRIDDVRCDEHPGSFHTPLQPFPPSAVFVSATPLLLDRLLARLVFSHASRRVVRPRCIQIVAAPLPAWGAYLNMHVPPLPAPGPGRRGGARTAVDALGSAAGVPPGRAGGEEASMDPA